MAYNKTGAARRDGVARRDDAARRTAVVIGMVMMIAAVLLMSGCATRSVSRIDGEEAIDLSGRWNDTDSRLVAESMIADINAHPWRDRFVSANGQDPVVIVGAIRNRSSDHIDVSVFIKDIERNLVNSGRVQVVADARVRREIRAEREDQQFETTEESRSRLLREVGADFILQGGVASTSDRAGGQQVIFYQIDLELINIETNVKTWIGTKEIRKFVEQSRVRF